MKVLITGAGGQLGRSLHARSVSRELHAVALTSQEFDIRDNAQIVKVLDTAAPDVVINTAAYTAVDKAEHDRERAFAVNRDGTGLLALACHARGIRLLHVSTDYVFSGTATRPHTEEDPISPCGIYAESKAAGESLVQAAGGTVIRTSWLFGEKGPSFVHTIARLARERSSLLIVADQHGCPTYAGDLADMLLSLAERTHLQSMYHYCNDGETTWHSFACAIVEALREIGPVMCEEIEAITTAEYPRPAHRPTYSVLDTTRIRSLGFAPRSWRQPLRDMLEKEFGDLSSPRCP
jgi:dTDP-4-dehydrorhamnose reductase